MANKFKLAKGVKPQDIRRTIDYWDKALMRYKAYMANAAKRKAAAAAGGPAAQQRAQMQQRGGAMPPGGAAGRPVGAAAAAQQQAAMAARGAVPGQARPGAPAVPAAPAAPPPTATQSLAAKLSAFSKSIRR